MRNRPHSDQDGSSTPKGSSQADKPQDEFESVQEFWNAWKQMGVEKEIDYPNFYRELAIYYSEHLGEGVAKSDFDGLVQGGCMAEPLALVVRIIAWAPTFTSSWQALLR